MKREKCPQDKKGAAPPRCSSTPAREGSENIYVRWKNATLFEIFQKLGRRVGSKWQKGSFEKPTNKPFLSFWLGKYIFSSSWPNSNTYLGKDLKIYMSDRRTQLFLRFFPRRADKSGQNDKKGCMNPREKPVAGNSEWFSVLSFWPGKKSRLRKNLKTENKSAGRRLTRKIRREPFPPSPSFFLSL